MRSNDGRLNIMPSPTVQRATCHEAQPDVLFIVNYRGSTLIVQRGKGNEWKIRRDGTTGVIHTLTEEHGLGKEEAIDWIERNY